MVENYEPVRLSYNTYEPEGGVDGPLAPVVFLHSLSALKEYWLDIPQKVADATKRKVYSLDARNHGDSEWSEDFNFDITAEDLVHFLDTHKIPKAILVGHSLMGGTAVVKTALGKPDRVESIVVEDMFVRKCPDKILDKISTFLWIMRKAVRDIPDETDEDQAKKLLFQNLRNTISEEAAEETEKKLKDPSTDLDLLLMKRNEKGHYDLKCNVEVLQQAIQNRGTLASDPEGVFFGPSLFIYATNSPFQVGDEENDVKLYFPNVVFEGIESHHAIHFSKTDEFTDCLIKFLVPTLALK